MPVINFDDLQPWGQATPQGAPQAAPAAGGISFDDLLPKPPAPDTFAQRFDAMPKPAPSLGETALDVAKSGGVGLAEGAIGLAGLPADLTNLATRGYDYLTGSHSNDAVSGFTKGYGSDAIQKQIEQETGPFYKPKTTYGNYARTVGQFAPAALGGPEGLATRLLTRAAIPGVASEAAGEATAGTPYEPVARVGGALAGAGLPNAVSRLISPATADPVTMAAANTLRGFGVDTTAGQATGSKALRISENELGNAPFAGGKATAANTRTMEQYTGAALREAGIGGTRATPEVMDNAFANNSNAFTSIAARNPQIPMRPSFATAADRVADDFENLTGARSPLLDRLSSQLAGPIISGDTYQAVQSDIGRYARAAGDPHLKMALYDLKGELDDAVGDGLRQMGNNADAQLWDQTRGQYKNLLVLERAVGSSTEAANQGLITPQALANADRAISGRRAYVRGTSNFSDLAHAGNAVLKPEANSNTSARFWAHALPSALGAMLGAGAEGFTLGGALGGLGAAVGPGMLGRAIMSPLAQAYLRNQVATPLRITIPLRQNLLTSGLMATPQAIQGQRPGQ